MQAEGIRSMEGQRRRLERALRQQHREAHGPTCECRAFEVEQVIAESEDSNADH